MFFYDKEIEAVIFDMDGTMFDTERLRMEMLNKASLELTGIKLSEEFLYSCLGVSAVTAENLSKDFFGKDYPYKQVRILADQYEQSEVHTIGVPVKKGLYNLLERLKKNGVFIALATSSKREIATEYLIQAKVLRYFDVLIFGDDVKKGKPDPEIFVQAFEQLNCSPKKCLIIEDSNNGILAASASGCHPVFIKDLLDLPKETYKKASFHYSSMEEFLLHLIPFTKKMPIPDINSSFPLNKSYHIAGIHGFGAIGGGYLAEIFSYWDGYTRPAELIGATTNPILLQVVNSIGKYRIQYEGIAFFKTIDQIKLIDMNDEDLMKDMYMRSHIIGLSLPESAINTESESIAKYLIERFRYTQEPLTYLILMNKLNAGKFVRDHIRKQLLKYTDFEQTKKILKNIFFCETVVNRMVSRLSEEEMLYKLNQNLITLSYKMGQNELNINQIQNAMQYFQRQNKNKARFARKKIKTNHPVEIISISETLSNISQLTDIFFQFNVTLFHAEPDMALYCENKGPYIQTLCQVLTVDHIKTLQNIKNKLSNGTHAIIAWYSSLLGYKTIGQGMGDTRVKKFANQLMQKELKPILINESPSSSSYINTFIKAFLDRCRNSFQDNCHRVGRDPLRKLKKGERILGAMEIADQNNTPTNLLEFGIACGILYSLEKAPFSDKQSQLIKSVFQSSIDEGDPVETALKSLLYNESQLLPEIYTMFNEKKDSERIDRITKHFIDLKNSIEKEP